MNRCYKARKVPAINFYSPASKLGYWSGCWVSLLVVACAGSGQSGNELGGNGGGTVASGGTAATTVGSGGATASGGKLTVGGTTATGGMSQVGGQVVSTGGVATGGAPTTTGGIASTGGAKPTGGSVTAMGGGTATGGSTATGGGSATGGAVANGGNSSAGSSNQGGRASSTGGVAATGGTSTAGSANTLPCDIYASANTPCVAAYSSVRALYGNFNGNLYQVQRSSDNTTKDIPVLSAGGFADSAQQDTFCANTTCIISKIYDQSPKANHLTSAPGGSGVKTPSNPVNAGKLKLNVGGHPVYAIYVEAKMGYRNNSKTTGLAKGDEPESMYMVVEGKHYNGGCCFDFGNAETTTNDDGEGTMETLYYGNTYWGHGGGNGPWIMADLENGVWAGNTDPYAANPSLTWGYVTAVLKGKAGGFTLKGGDAQTGALKTLYDGPRPPVGKWGGKYDPMRKQGAVVLGVGGDNSNDGVGTFLEGCITTGYTTDATDNAIQANIVATLYGK